MSLIDLIDSSSLPTAYFHETLILLGRLILYTVPRSSTSQTSRIRLGVFSGAKSGRMDLRNGKELEQVGSSSLSPSFEGTSPEMVPHRCIFEHIYLCI